MHYDNMVSFLPLPSPPQDYGELKDFFRSQFHQELREVELCVKGWNWGEAHFQGSLLSLMIDSKPAFEIPLKEVSQVSAVSTHEWDNTWQGHLPRSSVCVDNGHV